MAEVCIICRAFNANGEAIAYKRSNFNQEFDDAYDNALMFFVDEIKNISHCAEQTVRITVDIALPERWYDVQETT